jgi:hypothetical protein
MEQKGASMETYYNHLNERLLDLKDEFFLYHKKEDYSIIAISLHNFDNQNTWHLIDIDYIERFKDKQPTLKFGGFKAEAFKYPAYTKLVYHEDKNKRYVITPEKEKELKNKNIDINNLKILAERTRLAQFGEIWNIKDERLANLYRDQLISLKIGEVSYNAYEYREKVFIIKHKLSNKKSLCSANGKIVMKIQK